jgi:hypothetical protein
MVMRTRHQKRSSAKKRNQTTKYVPSVFFPMVAKQVIKSQDSIPLQIEEVTKVETKVETKEEKEEEKEEEKKEEKEEEKKVEDFHLENEGDEVVDTTSNGEERVYTFAMACNFNHSACWQSHKKLSMPATWNEEQVLKFARAKVSEWDPMICIDNRVDFRHCDLSASLNGLPIGQFFKVLIWSHHGSCRHCGGWDRAAITVERNSATPDQVIIQLAPPRNHLNEVQIPREWKIMVKSAEPPYQLRYLHHVIGTVTRLVTPFVRADDVDASTGVSNGLFYQAEPIMHETQDAGTRQLGVDQYCRFD